MRLINNAVVKEGDLYASSAPLLNISYGGFNRYIPTLGAIGPDGKPYAEFLSQTPYVKMNVIPVLMGYPKFFDYMPNPEMWIAMVKAFMETHPQTIDGLNTSISVEFDETNVTRSEVLEEAINSTRERSQITHTYKEKANRTYQNFLDVWIRYGIMDPDTLSVGVTEYINDLDQIGGIYLPHFKGCTMMYIEPDLTRKKVVNAWFCTNMQPKGTGDITGKSDIKSGAETLDLSISFTSITLSNQAVKDLAAKLLANMNIFKRLPDIDIIPSSQTIDPNISVHNNRYDQK